MSTQVWTWLRWAGMAASHLRSTGRGQPSAGGGGRSVGGRRHTHSRICSTGHGGSAGEASIHLIFLDPRGSGAAAGSGAATSGQQATTQTEKRRKKKEVLPRRRHRCVYKRNIFLFSSPIKRLNMFVVPLKTGCADPPAVRF